MKRARRTDPVTYLIEDQNKEEMKGSFYEQELQKTKLPEEFAIQEVLGERTRKRKKQVLVKWLGYPDSFNSWIDKRDLKRYDQ